MPSTRTSFHLFRRKRRRARCRSHRHLFPAIELLEERALLSVTFDSGDIIAVGSLDGEPITISESGGGFGRVVGFGGGVPGAIGGGFGSGSSTTVESTPTEESSLSPAPSPPGAQINQVALHLDGVTAQVEMLLDLSFSEFHVYQILLDGNGSVLFVGAVFDGTDFVQGLYRLGLEDDPTELLLQGSFQRAELTAHGDILLTGFLESLTAPNLQAGGPFLWQVGIGAVWEFDPRTGAVQTLVDLSHSSFGVRNFDAGVGETIVFVGSEPDGEGRIDGLYRLDLDSGATELIRHGGFWDVAIANDGGILVSGFLDGFPAEFTAPPIQLPPPPPSTAALGGDPSPPPSTAALGGDPFDDQPDDPDSASPNSTEGIYRINPDSGDVEVLLETIIQSGHINVGPQSIFSIAIGSHEDVVFSARSTRPISSSAGVSTFRSAFDLNRLDVNTGVTEFLYEGRFWDVALAGPRIVPIDVKPGSDENPINLASKGVIPVAVFTTDDFDASQIDVGTVTFAAATPVHSSLEDIDGDGKLDLILHFRTQDTNLRDVYEQLMVSDIDDDGLDSNYRQTDGLLTGKTVAGQTFQGMDMLDLFLSGKALRDLLNALP